MPLERTSVAALASLALSPLLLAIGLYAGLRFSPKIAVEGQCVKVDGALPAEPIEVPSNVFDGRASVGGGSVAFSYPKEGFYGLGLRMTGEGPGSDSDWASLVAISPGTGDQADLFMLSVEARPIKPGEALRAYVEGISPAERERTALVEIGGHEFAVTKKRDDTYLPNSDVWFATAFGEEDAVGISFRFTHDGSPFAQSAYRDADSAFLQILSRVDFK